MRKTINIRFMEIAIFSIIITTLLMTAVFYGQLKKQVFSDLEIIMNLLEDEEKLKEKNGNIRVTMIEADGTVLYDSEADETLMENHLNRPEVQDAIRQGVGYSVRKSETLSESTFYYAKKLEDGSVLRVGKEADNVVAVMLSALPLEFAMAVLLAFLCLLVSHYLTAEIIQPIDEITANLDDMREEIHYPELIPFIRKIHSQHEEILSAANIRQEFTANVSHELKTPLAAISGYAELMEAGLADEKDIRHFSGEISRCAGRLLTLINDIIKLSQLDAGNAGEVLESVDLTEIARESVELLTVSAQKSRVSILFRGTDKAMVKIGKELAQELIYNLIENAVRYNLPGGHVSVSVFKAAGCILLAVEDNGIGIPREHQERIFERFYRVDKSRSKELGGTGLGLAIVKHICTLTEGKIQLESEPDKGTKISILWEQ